MSRKVILTLIVLMALVMTSLILVQTNSIKKALEIKEEQFDASVKTALASVVRKLEVQEASNILLERSGYSPGKNNQSNYQAGRNFDKIIPRTLGQQDLNFSLRYSQQSNGRVYSEELSIGYSSESSPQPETERGNPGDFPNAFDEIHNSDSYLSQEYENRLNQKATYFEFAQSQIRIANLPLEQRIDRQFLERTLKTELRNYGINLDYKYAVKSFIGQHEKHVFGQDFNTSSQPYFALLFPSDIDELRKPNYLYVNFPKREGYLLKATGILVIPTVILTGLLIAIFVYTILIILKQKKLSIIKNDFINNMTHELKTPISTISLASQMLRDNTVSHTPKTIEHVSNVIYQESKRLSHQVEKVLQMAVFNEGRLKLKFKEVNLNSLISTVILNFELRVKNKNGELNSELKAENPIINGDEVHITNVIFNLLDNAVKYSKEAPVILITTENRKNGIVVSVKDNGIGIPKEHISQIFERFYRVPTGNVHDVKGFGLGLSYVKKIIDSHQGTIKVESTVNKGTKFMIYFPQNGQ
jgi:two-component system phosphate regulon sensor histidine kinase PhoR